MHAMNISAHARRTAGRTDLPGCCEQGEGTWGCRCKLSTYGAHTRTARCIRGCRRQVQRKAPGHTCSGCHLRSNLGQG